MPDPSIRRVRVDEPLEIRVGYGIDDKLMAQWQAALSTLQKDAGAPLSRNDDGLSPRENFGVPRCQVYQ